MSRYKIVTADEAAAYVNHGDAVGFSGFTPAGSPLLLVAPKLSMRQAKSLKLVFIPVPLPVIHWTGL